MPDAAPSPANVDRGADPDAVEYHAIEIGAGRPVVFVHDVYGAASNWTPTMEALSDDWRCLAVDLPGHGSTSRVDPGAGLDSIAGDLAQAVSSLGAAPATFVAHGAAAILVMRVAAERPDLATAVVLVSPGLVPMSAVSGTEDVGDQWFGDAYGESFFVEQPGRAAEEGDRVADLDFGAAAPLHAVLASPAAAAVLESARPLGRPTLVLGSMKDRLVAPSRIDDLARRLEADVEFMPTGGHMLPVERPEQVTSLIRVFLESL